MGPGRRPLGMDGAPTPSEAAFVHVAGAVATLEEALQVHQMRFILTWALRVQSVAPKPDAPQAAPPVAPPVAPSLVSPPM